MLLQLDKSPFSNVVIFVAAWPHYIENATLITAQTLENNFFPISDVYAQLYYICISSVNLQNLTERQLSAACEIRRAFVFYYQFSIIFLQSVPNPSPHSGFSSCLVTVSFTVFAYWSFGGNKAVPIYVHQTKWPLKPLEAISTVHCSQ